MPIGILLGPVNPAVLQSVRAFLEGEGFEVLGEAGDGRELVDLAVSLRPAVVILDCSMPRVSALEAAREIRNIGRETQVILLTQHAAEDQIITAFRAGIGGYVLKADTTLALARAIREVSGGRLFLSPGASRVLTEAYLPHQAVSPPPVRP